MINRNEIFFQIEKTNKDIEQLKKQYSNLWQGDMGGDLGNEILTKIKHLEGQLQAFTYILNNNQ